MPLNEMCDAPQTRCVLRISPMCVVQTSSNIVITTCDFYCCLLPHFETLHVCQSTNRNNMWKI